MHLHILGICGTFMGSLALLAREQGVRVSGSDAGVYPPMSTQLEQAGISLMEGYAAANLEPRPDLVVVGNAVSRGNPEVEALLDLGLPYTSGPQWLAEQVLPGRRVVAVAGTHGKTTTASLVAWLLEAAGQSPGFLIGGVPRNFGVSARLGAPEAPFVVEADEYDTAFFDKRSKFVHYRPDIAVLGNLEFDHADIFDDLAAIERQFHHLVRTVPGKGKLLVADGEPALERVLQQGCWTPVERFGQAAASDWRLTLERADAAGFSVSRRADEQAAPARVDWSLSGTHNARNALAAIAAAHACGVDVATAALALSRFEAPRRRQELRGEVAGISVIDDFAHHPTAIATTLEGLSAGDAGGRLLAVVEPRSNTMRLGTLRERLAASVDSADLAFWYRPAELDWQLAPVIEAATTPSREFTELDDLITCLVGEARAGDRIVVMSNGSFGGIHERLLNALEDKHGG